MDGLKYWLRWLAVLPGAAGVGFLATVPLHLVLYSTLSNFITPYPPLPERMLTPLVIGLALVRYGARIAPEYKVETAAVLFGLWMVLLGGLIALVLFHVQIVGARQLALYGGWVTAMLGFVGGLAGLHLARRDAVQTATLPMTAPALK